MEVSGQSYGSNSNSVCVMSMLLIHVLGYQPTRLLPMLQQKLFCSVLSKTPVTKNCESRQRRVSRNPPQSESQRSIVDRKDALITAVYQTSGIWCGRKCWLDIEFWWPWMTVTLEFRCMMLHVYQGNAGRQFVNLAKRINQVGTKLQNGHQKKLNDPFDLDSLTLWSETGTQHIAH